MGSRDDFSKEDAYYMHAALDQVRNLNWYNDVPLWPWSKRGEVLVCLSTVSPFIEVMAFGSHTELISGDELMVFISCSVSRIAGGVGSQRRRSTNWVCLSLLCCLLMMMLTSRIFVKN